MLLYDLGVHASEGGWHVLPIRTRLDRLREGKGVVGFGDGMGTQRRRQLTKNNCRIKSKTLLLNMKNKGKTIHMYGTHNDKKL